MILQDQVLDVQVQGDFPTTGFGIAGNAKSYEVLSKKIYNNKVQAVIREVCCNAYDAHVEADQDAQFKVHLPTTLESWFSVRDFGTGLTEQEVREIFCIYFCSTKTASNKTIGCLGLGSKSPFAVADSFTVTSWINGQKTVYSCYKDAKKSPQIALLTQEESDDPTGIEIKMTVQYRSSEFAEEAIRVFQYFDAQPAINVKSVVEAIEEAQKQYDIVHPDFSVSRESGDLMAVMGNVAYKIPEHRDLRVPNIKGFIRFDLGDLEFEPGREELDLDERTLGNLKAKIDLFKEEIQRLAIAQIEAQPTFYKKCVEFDKLNSGAVGDLVKFKVGNQYTLPEATTTLVVYDKVKHRKAVSKSEVTEFMIKEDNRIFFMEPRFEARIRAWLKDLGEGTVVLLTATQITEMQIDLDVVERLDAVVPKLDKAARGPRAANFKTFVWNGDISYSRSNRNERAGNWDSVTVNVADTTEEKVYVELNNWKIEGVPAWLESTDHIRNMTNQSRRYGVEVPQVYGLKTSILDTKAFKQGNWIKLEDYLRREIVAYAPQKVYQYQEGQL